MESKWLFVEIELITSRFNSSNKSVYKRFKDFDVRIRRDQHPRTCGTLQIKKEVYDLLTFKSNVYLPKDEEIINDFIVDIFQGFKKIDLLV